MPKTRSVIFVDDGKSARVYVDGEELQNVIRISIERDVMSPSIVTVVQRFFPEALSVRTTNAEINEVRVRGEDGET